MASTATFATTEDESPTTDAESAEHPPSERASVASSEEPTDLPMDVVFGLLSAERRRRVLRHLDENGGESTIGDLADHLAAAENGIDVAAVSSVQRKRVYVGLYQCHLPKLDDAGVVAFDQNRGTVEVRPAADRLFPHLYLDESEDEGDDGSDGSSTVWDALRDLAASFGRGA
jgi:DNA-binding transcriptional ArsR family regulator